MVSPDGHQISDRIIVLYRGSVVEEGDPDQIVNDPRHPYTRLLIQSIPEPDPERAWADDALDEFDEEEEQEAGGGGIADGPRGLSNGQRPERAEV